MKHIFLDAGAWNGDTIQQYLREHPECQEAVGFEPVLYTDEWAKIRQQFPRVKITFLPVAVWIAEGQQTFTLADYHTQSNTMMPGCEHYTKGKQITVPSIDLSIWIMQNTEFDDHIVLKLDVEGAEYDILEKMIAIGSIRRINELRVEFHDWIMPKEYEARHQKIIETCPIPIGVWG